MEAWRFIRDVPRDGFLNMAIDTVLQSSAGSTGICTLRVYTFDPTAITIGRFQPAGGFIDGAACKKAGVDVVRRPTGGLAILHRHDLTYSVTCPIEGSSAAARRKYFEKIGRGIVAGLDAAGIRADLSEHVGSSRGPGWCFEREFGVDIEWNARKICGSAQRVSEGALLQHGSMFLKENLELMSILAPRSDSGEAFVTVEEARGAGMTFEELAGCLEQGFRETLDQGMKPGELSRRETERATALCAEYVKSGLNASSGSPGL